ncbi:MAG: serine protease, partial [Planctomycetota bacterium]
MLVVCTAGLSCWLLLQYINKDRNTQFVQRADDHFSEQPLTEEERLVDELKKSRRRRARGEQRRGSGESPNGSNPDQTPGTQDPDSSSDSKSAGQLQTDQEAIAAPALPEDVEVIGGGLPDLHYGWQPGSFYNYQFSVYPDVRGAPEISGSYRLLAGPTWEALTADEETRRKLQPNSPEPELQKGSGSAFVVSEDGYLVTCAHVVERAEKVVVEHAGKRYNAGLVYIDHDKDIALLRIQATGLQPLAFSTSEKVR